MSFSQVIHILSYDNPGGKKSIYIYIYILKVLTIKRYDVFYFFNHSFSII